MSGERGPVRITERRIDGATFGQAANNYAIKHDIQLSEDLNLPTGFYDKTEILDMQLDEGKLEHWIGIARSEMNNILFRDGEELVVRRGKDMGVFAKSDDFSRMLVYSEDIYHSPERELLIVDGSRIHRLEYPRTGVLYHAGHSSPDLGKIVFSSYVPAIDETWLEIAEEGASPKLLSLDGEWSGVRVYGFGEAEDGSSLPLWSATKHIKDKNSVTGEFITSLRLDLEELARGDMDKEPTVSEDGSKFIAVVTEYQEVKMGIFNRKIIKLPNTKIITEAGVLHVPPDYKFARVYTTKDLDVKVVGLNGYDSDEHNKLLVIEGDPDESMGYRRIDYKDEVDGRLRFEATDYSNRKKNLTIGRNLAF